MILKHGKPYVSGELAETLANLPEDDTLLDDVMWCVNTIRGFDAPGASEDRFFEIQIRSEKHREHGGTIDVLRLCHTTNTLGVVDFKFGSHPVEVVGNAQIMCYLNLARELFPDYDRFTGQIIQPTHKEAKQHIFSVEELDEHDRKVAAAIEAGEARVAGVDQCRWCPLQATCLTCAKFVQAECQQFPDLTQLASDLSSDPEPQDVAMLERINLVHRLAKSAFDKGSVILKRLYNQGVNLEHHTVTTSKLVKWNKDATLPADDLVLPSVSAYCKRHGLKRAEFREQCADKITTMESKTLRLKKDARNNLDTLTDFDNLEATE